MRVTCAVSGERYCRTTDSGRQSLQVSQSHRPGLSGRRRLTARIVVRCICFRGGETSGDLHLFRSPSSPIPRVVDSAKPTNAQHPSRRSCPECGNPVHHGETACAVRGLAGRRGSPRAVSAWSARTALSVRVLPPVRQAVRRRRLDVLAPQVDAHRVEARGSPGVWPHSARGFGPAILAPARTRQVA